MNNKQVNPNDVIKNMTLSARQTIKAIKILEKPMKCEKPYYVEVENPIKSGDFLDTSPFYRDSVGTEELHEDTR